MFRAFLIFGTVVDILLALFLVLVFGYVLDSWNDPKGAWVGWVVTLVWLMAFLVAAGAPLLAHRLKRRQSAPARVALVIWLPSLVIIGVSVIGLMLSPP